MSAIRILSKKAFAIGPGAAKDGTIQQFVTVPMAIQDMPEMYGNDPTFIAAVKAGDIQVMSAEPSVSTNIKDADFTDAEENDSSVDKQIEEFYEDLKAKNREEVKELANQYDAEYVDSDKLSVNKKRVFEAYKLSLEK